MIYSNNMSHKSGPDSLQAQLRRGNRFSSTKGCHFCQSLVSLSLGHNLVVMTKLCGLCVMSMQNFKQPINSMKDIKKKRTTFAGTSMLFRRSSDMRNTMQHVRQRTPAGGLPSEIYAHKYRYMHARYTKRCALQERHKRM